MSCPSHKPNKVKHYCRKKRDNRKIKKSTRAKMGRRAKAHHAMREMKKSM
jgi:hypothetical protein